jgi:hypothetical protein
MAENMTFMKIRTNQYWKIHQRIVKFYIIQYIKHPTFLTQIRYQTLEKNCE